MDYVMDILAGLDVEELIVITGHLKEVVERYITEHYPVRARFVEQRTLDGTAGAINLARPFVSGPVLIVFVDTLFDADLSVIAQSSADGILWAKEVEDYRRFGVIMTDASGHMTRIIEKPATPISKLANIGLYYMRDWQALFDGIADVLRRPPGAGGEFYLTDAFQHMVDQGRTLAVERVTGWYDCGKVETLLETNHHLLEEGRAAVEGTCTRCTVHPPVYVEQGARVDDSIIGPNVTIEAGSRITSSTLAHTIVGRNVRISGSRIHGSLIGDDQVVDGQTINSAVLDAGELAPAR